MNYRKIKRLKALIPTLRERKRYFLIKIYCEKEISFEEIKTAILNTLKELYGEVFSKLMLIKIFEESFNQNTLIIRCTHLAKFFLSFALGKINEINGKKVLIRIIKISGTIRSLLKE
ncbi:MAG: Rpp14/Pop5 family protein [Candidatus Aenigmatarchaeota archaeon]